MITQYKEANLVLWVIYSLSHTAEESRESDFINTLPGIKNKKKGVIYIFLWHTAQGRCDHSGTGLIHNNNNSNNKNKNPLILFSVYLKQFDMRQKREEGVVALLK